MSALEKLQIEYIFSIVQKSTTCFKSDDEKEGRQDGSLEEESVGWSNLRRLLPLTWYSTTLTLFLYTACSSERNTRYGQAYHGVCLNYGIWAQGFLPATGVLNPCTHHMKLFGSTQSIQLPSQSSPIPVVSKIGKSFGLGVHCPCPAHLVCEDSYGDGGWDLWGWA